ncbi:M20 family metallopeptidase [Allobacillus sp. GCM10007491]|uniref:M20 family metallopeptidase n=1 Tax=Allobacillus saliphilus TaxID=2912308 RepID=A0A941HSC2_9BACI|nr:M20 family metallopeptidase [Allobacillus saliphilus]MBR7552535.1 M20 family metallopeptidase [Allobacillus saliphilus]
MEKTIRNQIDHYIDQNKDKALELLRQLVETESYTPDRDGVNRVSSIIEKHLRDSAFEVEIQKNEAYGNHVIATLKGNKKGKILMMGHQDTAHPTRTLESFPLEQKGNHLYGPGVSDMKSGLVAMIMAAKAIQQHATDEVPDLELLFTPDEEVGSPISGKVIQNRAKNASAVFNVEAGRLDGSIVTARKGSAHLRIDIEGKAAHSGAFYYDGISANDELAHKMIEIKKLVDIDKDLTINIGIVQGGKSNNIIASHGYMTMHLSFWKKEHFDTVYDAIKKISETSYIQGTESKLTGKIGILPMEENEGVRMLRDIVIETAEELKMDVKTTKARGAADAGFATAIGVPTICGMGPLGGNWHTKGEHMIMDSFIPRTKLLTHSVLKFASSV